MLVLGLFDDMAFRYYNIISYVYQLDVALR